MNMSSGCDVDEIAAAVTQDLLASETIGDVNDRLFFLYVVGIINVALVAVSCICSCAMGIGKALS
jgi:hypothetical protein